MGSGGDAGGKSGNALPACADTNRRPVVPSTSAQLRPVDCLRGTRILARSGANTQGAVVPEYGASAPQTPRMPTPFASTPSRCGTPPTHMGASVTMTIVASLGPRIVPKESGNTANAAPMHLELEAPRQFGGLLRKTTRLGLEPLRGTPCPTMPLSPFRCFAGCGTENRVRLA